MSEHPARGTRMVNVPMTIHADAFRSTDAKVRMIRLRLRVGRELLLVVLDLGTGTRRHQHRCPCRAGHLRTGTRPGSAANTAPRVGVPSEGLVKGHPWGLAPASPNALRRRIHA